MTTLTDQGMQRSLAYSAGMHTLLFALVIFGLPSFCQMKREAEPLVISMEILPLGPKANVAPTSVPSKRPEPAVKAPNVVPTPRPVVQDKPAPEPEKPKPPTVVEKEEAPAPKPEPVPEPEKEKPKPAEKPAPEKPKEEPKPKPAPKKPAEEKPKDKPKEEEMTLDDVLKNLEKSKPAAAASPAQSQNSVQSRSTSTSWDPTSPQAQALAGFIYQQVQPHWSPPIGAANAHQYLVQVKVKLRPDGSVADVRSATSARDGVHQSFIESAMRAVWKASPLKNLPADQYSNWQDVTIQFDPSTLF
jgi:outer membrane biosynthesis protein TonB